MSKQNLVTVRFFDFDVSHSIMTYDIESYAFDGKIYCHGDGKVVIEGEVCGSFVGVESFIKEAKEQFFAFCERKDPGSDRKDFYFYY